MSFEPASTPLSVSAERRRTAPATVLALIVVIILSAFLIGALARLAVPGPDPMPWWLTVLLGLGGSLLGGLIGQVLWGRPGGFILAVVGAVILLVLDRRFRQHRPLTGPGARRPPRLR